MEPLIFIALGAAVLVAVFLIVRNNASKASDARKHGKLGGGGNKNLPH